MHFDIDNLIWKLAIVLGLLGLGAVARRFVPRNGQEGDRWLIETLDSATLAIALVLLVIQPFLMQAFWIPSGSMENTLLVHDRLLVSRLIYRLEEPKVGDVIVFEAPPSATDEPGTDFIKRCQGQPGDVVEMRAGKLFRNGIAVAEPYALWNGPRPIYDMKIVGDAVYSREYYVPGLAEDWSRNNVVAPQAEQAAISAAAPGRVPQGKLLMLGDHRSDSSDGHVWGFAPRENVVGKAICVFWPPTRLGLVERKAFVQGAPLPIAATPNFAPLAVR